MIDRSELDAHLAALDRQRADAVETLHRIDGAIAGARHLIDKSAAKVIAARAAAEAADEEAGDAAA